MTKYIFERISFNSVNWDDIKFNMTASSYHSQQWLLYLKKLKHKLIIISIAEEDYRNIIGYFFGTICGIYPFQFVFSPYFGCGTYTQGAVFFQEICSEKRTIIYKFLSAWLLKPKRGICYISISDWSLHEDQAQYSPENKYKFNILERYNIQYSVRSTFYVPLEKSDDNIWKSFSYKSCRYCINKANKNNLQVKVVNQKYEIDEFLNEHYRQIVDVSNRHGTTIRPYQRYNNLYNLCHTLFPDKILMLQVFADIKNDGYISVGGG